MAARSPSLRAAEKIIAALNNHEADGVEIAAFLSFASEAIQSTLYKVCLKLIYNWAADFDASRYTAGSAYEGVCINAKRIVEAFEKKGGLFS